MSAERPRVLPRAIGAPGRDRAADRDASKIESAHGDLRNLRGHDRIVEHDAFVVNEGHGRMVGHGDRGSATTRLDVKPSERSLVPENEGVEAVYVVRDLDMEAWVHQARIGEVIDLARGLAFDLDGHDVRRIPSGKVKVRLCSTAIVIRFIRGRSIRRVRDRSGDDISELDAAGVEKTVGIVDTRDRRFDPEGESGCGGSRPRRCPSRVCQRPRRQGCRPVRTHQGAEAKGYDEEHEAGVESRSHDSPPLCPDGVAVGPTWWSGGCTPNTVGTDASELSPAYRGCYGL